MDGAIIRIEVVLFLLLWFSLVFPRARMVLQNVHHRGRHHDASQFPSTPLSEGFSHPRAPAWIARMPMVNWEAAGPTVRFAGVSLPSYIGSILLPSKRRHCSPRAINLSILHMILPACRARLVADMFGCLSGLEILASWGCLITTRPVNRVLPCVHLLLVVPKQTRYFSPAEQEYELGSQHLKLFAWHISQRLVCTVEARWRFLRAFERTNCFFEANKELPD